MGGVVDGQSVSAGVTNPAFIEKNADDFTLYVLGLKSPTEGGLLNSAQRAINTVLTATGSTETVPGTVYLAPTNTINDGDNHQTALFKLASKFAATGPVGHTHDGTNGNGPKIDYLNLVGAPTFPFWIKYTVSNTALQFAGLTNNIQLFLLNSKEIIHQIVMKQSASFTGGAIASYTLSVGISGNLDKYASAFDVFQAPGNTVFQQSTDSGLENMGATTSIKLAAVSTGANLDQSTTGSVDIYVLKSTLP